MGSPPGDLNSVPDGLRTFFKKIKELGVTTGLHCCQKISYSLLNEIKPDIFSFDATKELDLFCQDREVKKFLANGGKVAWGLIPTENDLSLYPAEALLSRWTSSTKNLLNKKELYSRSLNKMGKIL